MHTVTLARTRINVCMFIIRHNCFFFLQSVNVAAAAANAQLDAICMCTHTRVHILFYTSHTMYNVYIIWVSTYLFVLHGFDCTRVWVCTRLIIASQSCEFTVKTTVLSLSSSHYYIHFLYIYVHVCMCVCVCIQYTFDWFTSKVYNIYTYTTAMI
jgi:hypothetical protein